MLAPIEEIFCEIDDFCNEILKEEEGKLLANPERQRKRESSLSKSELMTLMVLFHLSAYRTMKDFYNQCVIKSLRPYFPRFVSYNRFVELQKETVFYLFLFLQRMPKQQTGIYYVDATKLPVCHIKRTKNNKTFKDIAQLGKTTTGWFFGFKLHLVINHQGEIMSFFLTPGNVDDRKPLPKLFKHLCGLAFGDKGYIGTKWAEQLRAKGVELITTLKNNMKKRLLKTMEKQLLRKRGVIETVIDILKNCCHISHTRHRSPDNFLANLISGLVAYMFRPNKPKINTSQLAYLPSLMSN
jgi:Transposase DDE domain